jgi:hypothetical protein
MDPKLTDPSDPTGLAKPADRPTEVKPPRRSRAAEYIAALYVALLLCSPWLVRDALLLTPPSNGVEIQVVARATAPVSTRTIATTDRATSSPTR